MMMWIFFFRGPGLAFWRFSIHVSRPVCSLRSIRVVGYRMFTYSTGRVVVILHVLIVILTRNVIDPRVLKIEILIDMSNGHA